MTEKDKKEEEKKEVKLDEKLVVEEVKEQVKLKEAKVKEGDMSGNLGVIHKEAETKVKEGEEKTEVKVKEAEVPMHKERVERAAIAYIFSSSNNTIVHITDLAGNTLSRVTGGMITKHSRLKSNPTTAMFVAKKAAERARDLGITSLYIRSRAKTNSPGLGPGGHAAIKTLGKEGFRIISLLDTTKVPRGGPKKKGGKRGRRV
jgi:small subunit ribosomal protein S11